MLIVLCCIDFCLCCFIWLIVYWFDFVGLFFELLYLLRLGYFMGWLVRLAACVVDLLLLAALLLWFVVMFVDESDCLCV